MSVKDSLSVFFQKAGEALFGKKLPYQPPADTALRYVPDPDMGLTTKQVEGRTSDGYVNHAVDKSTKSTAQIICSNVFTYFNSIFFILAFILLLERSYQNLTFLIVVVVNTIIGIVQEIKAKKTLEKLTLISAPLSKVIRDGREECVGSDELVLDDIVIFEAGNQISADAVVCDGEVQVNEALVTGEPDEIRKVAGAELMSGSYVVSGRCRARLTRVGYESFASKLTLDAKKIKKKQQPGMMRSLTLLIKVIGVIIIPFAVLMFINQHKILNLSVKVSVENTAASIIGMIPEGLYLLTSIALAVGVIRLAKKKTLVHDMKCIETLARVDVLCVDKTGTITEGDMQLKEILPIDEDGEEERARVTALVRDFALNMTADNVTMIAMRRYFGDKARSRRAVAIRGFSSATKFSAVSFGEEEQYLLGAPEFLLHEDYETFRPLIEEHTSLGERVLLLVEYRARRPYGNVFEGEALQGVVIPIALITLVNPIRPEARETFQYFASEGVAIKVISGDNPLTVSKAASDAGIVGAEKYIDATFLNTKEKIAKAATEYTVFGRVTPDQKRQLVRALKKAGHTVAMTGDGVNDVLALKDADCSIAMASGSDAAANVSDLVLLDSNFSAMPSVVAEGRRVINNIERSASLYLVKNIFSFILTVITLITVTAYPLKPAQLSLVSLVMIGIPSFCLALEPNRERVKGRFLRNVLFRSFPAALSAVFIVGWSLMFTSVFSPVIPSTEASVIAFYLYSFVAYLLLFRVCKPLTVFHKILVVAMGALFFVGVFALPTLFEIVPLTNGALLVMSVLIPLAYPIDRAIYYIFENFGAWKNKLRNYFVNLSEGEKLSK